MGALDRETNRVTAHVVPKADTRTMHGFVIASAAPGATVYTDSASGYNGLPFTHESVNHGRGEYVRGAVHTNGIESFWATVKRAYKGTFHWMSPKHLTAMCASSRGSTTSGRSTPSTRCGQWRKGWWGSG